MVSSLSRKLRRLQLGATTTITAIRWIGAWTVEVHPCAFNGRTKKLYVKADNGAERSFPHQGKRGIGQREFLSKDSRPKTSKLDSPRVVNHSGRKFIWARVASNKLSAACRKVDAIPRKTGYPEERRRRLKKALACRWFRLSTYAKQIGIPPVVEFSTSYRKWHQIEFGAPSEAAWDGLLAALPRKGVELPPENVSEIRGENKLPKGHPDRCGACGRSALTDYMFCTHRGFGTSVERPVKKRQTGP
jgi:hypothetical protein